MNAMVEQNKTRDETPFGSEMKWKKSIPFLFSALKNQKRKIILNFLTTSLRPPPTPTSKRIAFN